MDIMDTHPIPFSWMSSEGTDYHTVFEASSPEKRELAVWLSGYWKDMVDVNPRDIRNRGSNYFSVYVDPDYDDKFISRIVKGLV